MNTEQHPEPVHKAHNDSDHQFTPTSPHVSSVPKYESNPFLLGFDGLSRMFKYAQAVAITILVLGVLGGFGNMFNRFPSSSSAPTNSNNSSTNITAKDSPSLSSNNSNNNSGSSSKVGTKKGDATDTNKGISVVGIIAIIVGVIVVFAVVFLLSTLLSAAITGVYAAAGNASADGVTLTFFNAFKQMTNRFWTLYFASILVGLKVLGGYLLLIVPGVRASLRYASVNNIVLKEKHVSATQALTRAKELYAGHLLEVYGLTTAAGIVPVVGQIMNVGGIALSYKQISDYKAANIATPKTHWLNYIGFMILGLIVLFAAFIGLIVLAVVASKQS